MRIRAKLDSTDFAKNLGEPDSLAFSVIVFFAMTSDARGKIPTILRTVAEDAMLYFLFIFTAHFVLEMTLNLARVSATVPSMPVCNQQS